MTDPIHQEIELDATPKDVFAAYMQADRHEAFTGGGGTEIDPVAGGAFSCHGGRIEGRTIELVEDARIVQAWRPANWPAGVYSLVRIDLAARGDGTLLTLDHWGIPAAGGEHLAEGWNDRYWTPLRAWLARTGTA